MSILPGIRPKDQEKFEQVARTGFWILVRGTNENSFRYIGEVGFVPKPLTCKAKTADAGEQAGLVISPKLRPEAFTNPAKAKKYGNQMLSSPGNQKSLPEGYEVDSGKQPCYHGCLRYRGNLIHADYDLFDVVSPDAPRRLLALYSVNGEPASNMTTGIKAKVQIPLNKLLGVDMVQHGVHVAFGTFDDDDIVLAFGPKGERFVFRSTTELKKFYDDQFQGRTPLNLWPKKSSRRNNLR